MKRWNFAGIMARVSTWLALASLSATAGLAAYGFMPARAQDAFPDWALLTLSATVIVSAVLVPVATSFKQKNLP